MKRLLLACAAVVSVGVGHARAQSAGLVVLSNCGTSPPAVTNNSGPYVGSIVTGTGSPTACTISLPSVSIPWPSYPRCVVTASTGSAPVGAAVTSRSSTSITITLASGTSSAIIDYICQ